MDNPRPFIVEVVRVKTMADGSPRYEFGGGENQIDIAAYMIYCQQEGIALEITAKPVNYTKIHENGNLEA